MPRRPTCVEATGRDPQQALLYTNFVYNDPVVLRFDPPILIYGAAPVADRTFTYCGHYDNGKAPNPQEVKRRSTSPPAGVLFDVFAVGGPCAQIETRCIGGPQPGPALQRQQRRLRLERRRRRRRLRRLPAHRRLPHRRTRCSSCSATTG